MPAIVVAAVVVAAATVASTVIASSNKPGQPDIPPVPGPTTEETAFQKAQTTSVETQTQLMQKQIAQMDLQLKEQQETKLDKTIANKAIEAQTQLMQKQMAQMDLQLKEQQEMNATIDKMIADKKAEEAQQVAWAANPETAPEWYQTELSRKAKEEQLIDYQLDAALGKVEITPEIKTRIDTEWNAGKEEAQVEIDRAYKGLTDKIASGQATDLETIDTDYADLMRKIDREIPGKAMQTWRNVSPLMRDSATAASAMAQLATEVSRVKEDLIMSQSAAKTGITRRATEATVSADKEKALAQEQLAKQTEAGKLGAYESARHGLGTGYSSLPAYYTTGLKAEKEATELQTALLPYQTKLGLSQNVAQGFLAGSQTAAQLGQTALNWKLGLSQNVAQGFLAGSQTAANLGQTAGQAANALYTQRFQPWQVGANLGAQSSMNAYNQRMALMGAGISTASRLGAAYMQA